MAKIVKLSAFSLIVVAAANAVDAYEPCMKAGETICRLGGYQICAHHDQSGLTYGPIFSCGSAGTCLPAANGGILCRPPSALLECPFDTRRCFNATSTQHCTNFPRGTVWADPTPCADGQTCQDGQCYAGAPPPLRPCRPGAMQCATATTFRTCDPAGQFSGPQLCPSTLQCKQQGESIDCVMHGLVI